MTDYRREDVELYLMGEYDGDVAALEAAIAADPALAAMLAEEAALESALRDAGAEGVFCAGCHDLVERDASRCAACGVAVKPGGYVVDRVLVSNAHGRMYVARDADGTRVALKELAFVQSPTLDAIAMFEREARFLRALEHPAIPRFVASFEEGTGVHTRYYLAQELVSGVSLADKLEDHFFTEAEIVDLARQVLEVLVYLQSVSPMIIHRDIKPANLIAKPDGKIAVVDFGAAHVQGTTAGSTSIGTFGYMPIEQLAGQVDATTDVYALGASLIHLLSRREPWRLLQGASLEGINVSPAIREFLAKLVATEPAHRFARADAALAGLDHAAAGGRIMPIASAKRPRRFVRPAAMLAGALGLAAAGYGARAVMTPSAAPAGTGRVHVQFAPAVETNLFVDNVPYGKVGNGFTVDVEAGKRFVRLTPGCTELVDVEPGEDQTVFCMIESKDMFDGKVRFELRGGPTNAELFVDGVSLQIGVFHDQAIVLPSGLRTFRLVSSDGAVCEQQARVERGKTTTVACTFRKGREVPAPSERIPPGKPIDLDFKATSLHDVMRTIADSCGLNAVIPTYVDAKTTISLKQAPCDQALEVILESHGLWYRYHAAGNILHVAPRNQIDRDAEAAAGRVKAGIVDDPLPSGPALDLDVKDASLHDLMRLFASAAGVNVVLPEHIDAKVTLKLKQARWDVALTTILDANGLWYRYRPNGKLLRIGTRNELDREAEAARAQNTR